jgi:hypothetical protein
LTSRVPRGGRSTLRLVAIVALGGAAIFGLWVIDRLPDPATADGSGLIRWLVTRDLSQESAATRSVLVERLAGELRRGIAWGEVQQQLSTERRALVGRNIEVLIEQWFHDTVAAYYEQPEAQRTAYVDEQIDRLFDARAKQQDGQYHGLSHSSIRH